MVYISAGRHVEGRLRAERKFIRGSYYSRHFWFQIDHIKHKHLSQNKYMQRWVFALLKISKLSYMSASIVWQRLTSAVRACNLQTQSGSLKQSAPGGRNTRGTHPVTNNLHSTRLPLTPLPLSLESASSAPYKEPNFPFHPALRSQAFRHCSKPEARQVRFQPHTHDSPTISS